MGRRRERERWLNTAESRQEDKRREQLRLKLNLIGILALLIMLLLSLILQDRGKSCQVLTGS
jgi:hypothetical protein